MIERIGSFMQGIARGLRAVLGVPDYDSYLDHTRSAHPDRVPMSRAEFVRERMESRYNKPGARCC